MKTENTRATITIATPIDPRQQSLFASDYCRECGGAIVDFAGGRVQTHEVTCPIRLEQARAAK